MLNRPAAGREPPLRDLKALNEPLGYFLQSDKKHVFYRRILWDQRKVLGGDDLGEGGERITVELVAVRLETLLAQSVEQVALLLVRQDLEGLGHLIEALRGMGVLVHVRMVALCQLAVLHTDLIVSGSAAEAQHLVEVLAHVPAG